MSPPHLTPPLSAQASSIRARKKIQQAKKDDFETVNLRPASRNEHVRIALDNKNPILKAAFKASEPKTPEWAPIRGHSASPDPELFHSSTMAIVPIRSEAIDQNYQRHSLLDLRNLSPEPESEGEDFMPDNPLFPLSPPLEPTWHTCPSLSPLLESQELPYDPPYSSTSELTSQVYPSPSLELKSKKLPGIPLPPSTSGTGSHIPLPSAEPETSPEYSVLTHSSEMERLNKEANLYFSVVVGPHEQELVEESESFQEKDVEQDSMRPLAQAFAKTEKRHRAVSDDLQTQPPKRARVSNDGSHKPLSSRLDESMKQGLSRLANLAACPAGSALGAIFKVHGPRYPMARIQRPMSYSKPSYAPK